MTSIDISFWAWITRLGEAGIVLPVGLASALWLAGSARSVRPASSWLLPLGLAVCITALSKIAFIGWGIGIASIDYTGFSGHSMFAAAVYPLLAHAVTIRLPARHPLHAAALAAGVSLAALIAYSRIKVGAHSASEVVAGFVLGALASGVAIWLIGRPQHRLPARWIALALAGWMVVTPGFAARSRTHDMVTKLALTLSQRSVPYRRADLHRHARGALQTLPAADMRRPVLH